MASIMTTKTIISYISIECNFIFNLMGSVNSSSASTAMNSSETIPKGQFHKSFVQSQTVSLNDVSHDYGSPSDQNHRKIRSQYFNMIQRLKTKENSIKEEVKRSIDRLNKIGTYSTFNTTILDNMSASSPRKNTERKNSFGSETRTNYEIEMNMSAIGYNSSHIETQFKDMNTSFNFNDIDYQFNDSFIHPEDEELRNNQNREVKTVSGLNIQKNTTDFSKFYMSSGKEPCLINLSRFSISPNDYELNYYRDGEELRRSYIAKLIYKNVWTPTKKDKNHNTLIIFDWDDTLLCTSFLTPDGIFDEEMELDDNDKEKISKLEQNVHRILSSAVEKGDTYIITNAAPGWVEYSCERFYPTVKSLLQKIKIISARGDYEKDYPGDSRSWKIQAFLKMQKDFANDLVTNIICLGDSFIEIEAAHELASKFTQAFIKTVKFRECPKPEELNKQLGLVVEQFNAIYATVKNLTVRVEKKGKK